MSESAQSHIGFVRRSLAVLVALAGVASVLASTRFARDGLAFNFWLGPATAWLSQHNVVVGFAFLYLARQIYQGERTALKISAWLMAFQVVKFSLVEFRVLPLIIYTLLLIILILSRGYFIRHSSPRHFVGRLKAVFFALVASVAVIALLGVVFRLRQPEIWKNSTFNAGRVVARATLLEVRSDPHDPLRARLFGQLLTAAGIAMYGWILAGLFSPALYSRHHADEAERERMLSLLNEYGRSSEDNFKLWPTNKNYWFNENNTAGIAYKQYKGYVIALEAPVGNAHARGRAAMAFRNFCRGRGWKLAWLLVNEATIGQFENSGLKKLKIGASAVVSLDQYARVTVTNKWWRWVRNKNGKLGLHYEKLSGPINEDAMNELRSVSDAWLGSNSHNEFSFALGYFDESYLRECIIHTLKDENDKIVAFTNQLPAFHFNSQTTIDLMRALPEYDGAITYLLSEMLLGLHAEGRFKTFDLGFVPLAQDEETVTKKAVLTLTTTLLNAYFSARGLRQFKNKFDPTWQDNYLAWDGDWLDLPAIASAIDKVLTFETVLPADKS